MHHTEIIKKDKIYSYDYKGNGTTFFTSLVYPKFNVIVKTYKKSFSDNTFVITLDKKIHETILSVPRNSKFFIKKYNTLTMDKYEKVICFDTLTSIRQNEICKKIGALGVIIKDKRNHINIYILDFKHEVYQVFCPSDTNINKICHINNNSIIPLLVVREIDFLNLDLLLVIIFMFCISIIRYFISTI